MGSFREPYALSLRALKSRRSFVEAAMQQAVTAGDVQLFYYARAVLAGCDERIAAVSQARMDAAEMCNAFPMDRGMWLREEEL